MKILITRPEPEASQLAQALSAVGHQIVNLPLIEIKLTPRHIDFQGEELIFVSKNAVRGMQNLADLTGKKVFALGPGTAQILQTQGIEVIYPDSARGSEAFLALPELRQVSGRCFILVSGDAGRDEMMKVLTARGATVKRLCVYEGRRVVLDQKQKALLRAPYDLAIITSLDALRYACECRIRREIKVSILSNNMLKYAMDYGLRHFLKLELASHAEILTKIKEGL